MQHMAYTDEIVISGRTKEFKQAAQSLRKYKVYETINVFPYCATLVTSLSYFPNPLQALHQAVFLA